MTSAKLFSLFRHLTEQEDKSPKEDMSGGAEDSGMTSGRKGPVLTEPRKKSQTLKQRPPASRNHFGGRSSVLRFILPTALGIPREQSQANDPHSLHPLQSLSCTCLCLGHLCGTPAGQGPRPALLPHYREDHIDTQGMPS